MEGRGARVPGSGARTSAGRDRPRQPFGSRTQHDGGRRDAIVLATRHGTVRPVGGAIEELLCLPFGGKKEGKTEMKKILLLLAISSASIAQEPPKVPATVKVTRVATPKALKFEVEVPAKLDDVWTAFTT